MNQLPGDAHLIDRLIMARGDGASKQWTASQKAQIGKKTVTITLHFDQFTSLTVANKLMKLSLEKVANLEIAPSSPLQSGERVFHLKVIPQIEVVQERIESLQSQLQVLPTPEFEFLPVKTLSASPSTVGTRGKTIQDKFHLRGGGTATEKAVRADTVTHLLQSLQTKKARLNEQLKSDPNNRLLQEELKRTEKEIKTSSRRKGNATWGSTNSPRFAFRDIGRRIAKEILSPIICNLRMQTLENADGKIVSAITRSAAISDFGHGEVSLQELKDLHDLENWNTLSEARKIQLTKLYLVHGTKTNNLNEVIREIKVKALVGYGLDRLTTSVPNSNLYRILDRLQMTDSISQALLRLNQEDIHALDAVSIDSGKLHEIIQERSRHLKQMVLQDLQLHLETRPAENDSMLYCRTSVVDMQKASKNEHGLILDEKTQSLDMKALFDELEGTELIFDCTGDETAFIDEQGKIHMPVHCSVEGVLQTKLETVFFNICTQGSSDHTQNNGMQQAINDEALAKLQKRNPTSESLKTLMTSLENLSTDSKQDPNDAVLLATLHVQEQGGYAGINCFGGKDRTGYAVALLTHHHLTELDRLSPQSPAAQKWGHQLLSRKGVAAKIAEDNADHTILKLTRVDLFLYNLDTLSGKMHRGAHAISGLFKVAVKTSKELLGLDSLSISKTEDQLYMPIKASRLSKFSVVRKIKSFVKNFPF